MKTITWNVLQLSQYHAGQSIELSASIVCDQNGIWHAVLGTLDRSDDRPQWKYDVTQHDTEADAVTAIARAGLLIASESWRHCPGQPLTRLDKLLRPHGYGLYIIVEPESLTAVYYFGNASADGRHRVPLADLLSAVLRTAKEEFSDLRIGRYPHIYAGADEFEVNTTATSRFRRTLDTITAGG